MQSSRAVLFFLILMLIAYFPATSFMFFLKNDAFTGYFPPKFFMSECIKSGYLPLWNPYINFGIPQYGDISSGFWNPITWLIASTVGYNAYTFTIEVFLYILLGGIGFYKVAKVLDLHPSVQKISALAYMCSGFMVGHLQHFNWLSGAAFFPWCFWSYQLLITRYSFKIAVQTAIFFYLLIASAHPGITIGAFYFFIAYTLYFTITTVKKNGFIHELLSIFKTHFWFFAFLLLFSVGLIIGYLDILPFFTRGEKLSLNSSLGNPTTFQSWISLLLPFSSVKNDIFFCTDIAMRNCYFSLVLGVMLIISIFSKKNKLQLFFWIIGALFLLLSTGGIYKKVAYNYLPLLGYVRLNGEFRLFTIISFILISALELNKYISKEKLSNGFFKLVFVVLGLILGVLTIYSLTIAAISKESILFNLQHLMALNGISEKLKYIIDAISFYDTIWTQGIIQVVFLGFIYNCFKNKKWHSLVIVVSFDLIIACLLNIPFTGVGKTSVANVQSVLNQSPKGIPKPSMSPIAQNESKNIEIDKLVGDWSFYNKQIGSKSRISYPIILKTTSDYFDSTELSIHKNDFFESKPFVFLIDTTASSIEVLKFSPQKIIINTNSTKNNSLILQQNFYPHWFYNIGNVKHPVIPFGINFIKVPIPKGVESLTIVFEPKWVLFGMAFSALALVIGILILLFGFRKQHNVNI